jgi:hypothetical protein
MSKGTQIVYITGEAKWARVYEDQMDTEYGERFHINVSPDETSLIVLKTSGSRVSGKEDEDGRLWFKFNRDNKKEFKPGEVEVLGPPKVVHKVGEEYKPFDKRIGNGSIVTVKLAIYNSKKGKGTRLEAVCVDEHVPYEPNGTTAEGTRHYAF